MFFGIQNFFLDTKTFLGIQKIFGRYENLFWETDILEIQNLLGRYRFFGRDTEFFWGYRFFGEIQEFFGGIQENFGRIQEFWGDTEKLGIHFFGIQNVFGKQKFFVDQDPRTSQKLQKIQK